jgi:beta-lactamase regulating signal transducer with metallopeptidase domain
MLAIAWMLTYLLHSSLLLGLAWLVSKPLSRWSVAAEETVWKLALVGALFTASLQLAAGWQPLAGRWNLAAPAPAAEAAIAAPAPMRAAETSAIPVREILPAPARVPVAERAAVAPAASRLTASRVALGVWALGALLLLAGFGRSYLRLERRLRSRPRVIGGTLHGQLRGLAAEAGLAGAVRLSCSSRVPVPVALGVRRPEICVPPRALAGLTDEQQEGMLAHELAHLARRDPLWLLLGQGIACVLFFQPLNWVARRRLREISEVLSDEWAVARTGRPLSLAACLAEVAGWSVGAPALPVPGMADRPSSLGKRIRRLLDDTRSPENPARRIWLAAAMGLLVLVVAAAAPAISTDRPEPPPAKAPVATAAAPAAIDVNDATDMPTHPAAPAVSATGHQAMMQNDAETHAGMKERDDDEDVPDVDVDTDDINDQVNDSVQAALDEAQGHLEALSTSHELSHEQQEKLSRDMERTNRKIEQDLKPRIEKLAHELAEKSARMAPSPEMKRLTEEMAKLGEQMRPSAEAMAKMQERMAQDMEKLHADGDMMKLSAEERERITRQAKEMAEMAAKLKPTEEQRRRMAELRDQLHRASAKMGEQFRAENHEEMEKLQREIHEEVEREMQGMRDEIRRSLDERKAIERQDRHDRKTHERHHDAKPDPDDDHDGDGKAPKPPVKPAACWSRPAESRCKGGPLGPPFSFTLSAARS